MHVLSTYRCQFQYAVWQSRVVASKPDLQSAFTETLYALNTYRFVHLISFSPGKPSSFKNVKYLVQCSMINECIYLSV